MRTIIVKNLSTRWDENILSLVSADIASRRDQKYKPVFDNSIERYDLNVEIVESDIDGRITYTFTDK